MREYGLSVSLRWTGFYFGNIVASACTFAKDDSNIHLHIEPRLEGSHVVHSFGKRNRLRLRYDRVDLEVRQQELRHDWTGGHTRPVRSEQVGNSVNLSVLALGDVEPLERRQALKVLFATCACQKVEGTRAVCYGQCGCYVEYMMLSSVQTAVCQGGKRHVDLGDIAMRLGIDLRFVQQRFIAARITCGEPDEIVAGEFREGNVPNQGHPVNLCLLRGLRGHVTQQ